MATNLPARFTPRVNYGGAVVRTFESVKQASRFLTTTPYSEVRKRALDFYHRSAGRSEQIINLGNEVPETTASAKFQAALLSQGLTKDTERGKVYAATLGDHWVTVKRVGSDLFEVYSHTGVHRSLREFFETPFSIRSIAYEIRPPALETLSQKVGTTQWPIGYRSTIDLAQALKKLGFTWDPTILFPFTIGTMPFELAARYRHIETDLVLKITGHNTFPDCFRREIKGLSTVYSGIRGSSAQPGAPEIPHIKVEVENAGDTLGFVERPTIANVWRAAHTGGI